MRERKVAEGRDSGGWECGKVREEVIVRLVNLKFIDDVRQKFMTSFPMDLLTSEEKVRGFVAGVGIGKRNSPVVDAVNLEAELDGNAEERGARLSPG